MQIHISRGTSNGRNGEMGFHERFVPNNVWQKVGMLLR
jgi:hypothetical protein